MVAIYLLAAIVGLPLVGYAVLAGEGDGETGDLESGGVFAYLSIGTLSFFAGFFGLTGLATTAVGTGATASLLLALVVGLVAAGAQRGLLTYVKRSSSSSHVDDVDFAGRAGRVIIPIEAGKRGRIALELGDQRHLLSAELTATEHQSLAVGDSVVIVEIDRGVARVAHLDPELG